MTLSGTLFLTIGFYCALMFCRQKNKEFQILPMILFIYHLGCSLFYCNYSISHESDAEYYFGADPYQTINIGSAFILWLTANARDLFSASYLDLFLLFHVFGYLGLMFLYKTLNESSLVVLKGRIHGIIIFILFLPGLNFWTSAIGKDSLIFFGITLFTWGLLKPRARLAAFVIGIFFVFMIRPHVAAMIFISTGLALLWSSNVSRAWKITTGALIAAVITATFAYVLDFVGLQSTDSQSIIEAINTRQGYNQVSETGVDITDYPFVFQVFTYLYRPLFLDSPNLLGVIVSVENLFYLFFSTLLFIPSFRWVLKNHTNTFFFKFNLFFFLVGVSIFAMTTGNLGIAIRQKTMILPSLLILLATTYGVSRTVKVNKNYHKQHDLEWQLR